VAGEIASDVFTPFHADTPGGERFLQASFWSIPLFRADFLRFTSKSSNIHAIYHFAQGKLQGGERKPILQEVQTRAKAAALRAIRPLLSAFLDEELTAKLCRGKREPRRVSGQARLIDWQGGSCGCRDANRFTRDGHYRRNLETGWGELEDLQVPMLECQQCLHDVVAYWTIVEKFKRFWLDWDQDVLFGTGLCQSLRESPRTVECHVGQ
jgi:hypothetical protein